MTTTVKIEHRGGSHPVVVAVSGVPRAVLYAPGDAWEGVVYANGGEISVAEHEAPSRPDVLGIGSGPPDDRLRAAEENMQRAAAYVEATEEEANYARRVAADARAAYVKLQTESGSAAS